MLPLVKTLLPAHQGHEVTIAPHSTHHPWSPSSETHGPEVNHNGLHKGTVKATKSGELQFIPGSAFQTASPKELSLEEGRGEGRCPLLKFNLSSSFHQFYNMADTCEAQLEKQLC